jgi:hypothetical protein
LIFFKLTSWTNLPHVNNTYKKNTSFCASPALHMRTLIKNASYRHKSSDDLCLHKAIFYKCFHVWSGRCTKIDVLVPNWQTFRTIYSKLTSLCAYIKQQQQQKQNCCASDQPWQRSFWPNATTNQQSRGTSLTRKMIANSAYDFIMVDCYLAAFCLNLVKLPLHGYVDHDNHDFLTAAQAIQLRPLE